MKKLVTVGTLVLLTVFGSSAPAFAADATFSNDTTGPQSSNTNAANVTNTMTYNVTNNATSNTTYNITADTGHNTAQNNTTVTGMSSGAINFSSTIKNDANTNANTTVPSMTGGTTTVSSFNHLTGPQSTNTNVLNQSNNSSTNITNNAVSNTTVNANLNTGGNTAANNTTVDGMGSGPINIAINQTNTLNSNPGRGGGTPTTIGSITPPPVTTAAPTPTVITNPKPTTQKQFFAAGSNPFGSLMIELIVTALVIGVAGELTKKKGTIA
jgi:hypothetical protein